MPKFVIRRNLPNAGKLSPAELQAIYLAPSEDAIREHARRGGFPADSVARVRAVIDPTTAEA